MMAHEHFLDDIGEQLDVVFARLKPNSLRSFEYVKLISYSLQ